MIDDVLNRLSGKTGARDNGPPAYRGSGLPGTASFVVIIQRILGLAGAVWSGCLLVLLAGCAVGPNYQRPAVQSPDNYRDAAGAATNSLADLAWWDVYQDETLRELVRTALTNNYDLRLAVSRAEQAREFAAQTRGQFVPAVGYEGAVSRGRNEFLGRLVPTAGHTDNAMSAALTASWELDLWGRIRRLNESARARYLASEEGRRDVTLGLVSQVAQAWFELLELDLRLEIARRSTNSFGDSFRIFSQRLEGGVVSKLESSRAEAALASAAASVPETERQIAVKENEIGVLIGHNPGPVARQTTLLAQTLPPEVPAGLPSSLLQRRPDVRAAEQLLRAANADIGVSVAEFFPKIGLSAALGRVSSELALFTSGGANAWSIAASAAGPLFQGGALRAQHRAAKARWDEARLLYERTVLESLREVANALISREKLEEVRVQQARAVRAYQEAVSVSSQRYVAGKASYYEVLEAQQQLFPAENALAETQLNQLLVIVQLYKALGGGWQLADPDWATGGKR